MCIRDRDSVPEVPGWPAFVQDGELLRRDSPRRKARLLVWRNERTRSSPFAESNRGSCHMQPSVASAATEPRPTFDDVRLPTPPAAGLSTLQKLKREMIRSNYPAPLRRRRQPTSKSATSLRKQDPRPRSPTAPWTSISTLRMTSSNILLLTFSSI